LIPLGLAGKNDGMIRLLTADCIAGKRIRSNYSAYSSLDLAMPSVVMTWGFSFRRFIELLGRALDVIILPSAILNLLWVFWFHEYTSVEIVFHDCLQILVAFFLIVQVVRLFTKWRWALFGLGRAVIYVFLSSFMYL
jgi:hypothetical protein